MSFKGKKYTVDKSYQSDEWWEVFTNGEMEVVYSFREDEIKDVLYNLETLLLFGKDFVKMSCAEELFDLVVQVQNTVNKKINTLNLV